MIAPSPEDAAAEYVQTFSTGFAESRGWVAKKKKSKTKKKIGFWTHGKP